MYTIKTTDVNFEIYLREQLKKHPSMQPQDVVKMCYQAAFGAEHLLTDIKGASMYLQKEYDLVSAENGDLIENISDSVCRINLSAWKNRALPIEWLFRMFAASSGKDRRETGRLDEYLQIAGNCLDFVSFTREDWEKYIALYDKAGHPAVHHSEKYRIIERPAYRIIDSRFSRILPVLEKAKDYKSCGQKCIIAIDGRAASGKTTLADDLRTVLDAEIIHMDDFFLPSCLRTEQRLNEAGGNIHYERFAEEVLPFVSEDKPFAYRVFDCHSMDYSGVNNIEGKQFVIVEGSYSLHPGFGKYADIAVFSDISPEEQITRIRKRNGEKLFEIFKNKWIPLEEKYFDTCEICKKADLVI